ncbi:MAG: hypothetical protein WCO66_04540 [Candidatus Absconditabacteria bacterium]
MDPVQIPVPTAPIVTPIEQVAVPQAQAPVVAQDDFFDKFLKGLVATIGKLMTKTDTAAGPTVPLGAVPQAPVIPAPANLLGSIGAGLENVANTAVNLTQSGVNSVVQNAQNYIAEPTAPAQSAVAVQDFLSQNYQSAPTVAPTTPVETPVVTPIPTAEIPAPTPTPVQ